MPPVLTHLRRPSWPVFAGLTAFMLALAIWAGASDTVRDPVRERVFDHLAPLLFRPAPTRPEAVIVDIDRAAKKAAARPHLRQATLTGCSMRRSTC